MYYLAKSEPPLLNMPACGGRIAAREVPQIIFSWLPRHTASPNAAAQTEYEFSLYEVRPKGRNPNDVVLTTPPVYRATTRHSQLVYGLAEPMLIDSLQYVWRVQAIDGSGRDAFRNRGYSEVCTFTYGGVDPLFSVGLVEGFAAEPHERRARLHWQGSDAFDGYRVQYKASRKGYEWFSSQQNTAELVLHGLEPDTEYEARVQGKKSGVWGGYTPLISFRTLPLPVVVCGDAQAAVPQDPGKPLTSVLKGMMIEARGMTLTLGQVEQLNQPGWYKGMGEVSVPYLAGAVFKVKFDRLYINEAREAPLGRIDFLTRGVAEMAEKQLAGQKQRQQQRKQEENRQAWEGTPFAEKVFKNSDVVIGSVTADPAGGILITDSQGNVLPDPGIVAQLEAHPDKAVIIEDKNGDQWVVQKDEEGNLQVSKVEGGGLPPMSSIIVSKEDLDILKKALAKLKSDYPSNRMQALTNDYNTKKAALLSHNSQVKQGVLSKSGASQSQTIQGSSSQARVLFMQELEPGTETFDNLSIAFKAAELALNTGKVALIFCKETNRENDYKLLAQWLRINSMVLNEYNASEKAKGSTDDQIAIQLKQSILQLIEQVLDNE
jgi:hypothetical protein